MGGIRGLSNQVYALNYVIFWKIISSATCCNVPEGLDLEAPVKEEGVLLQLNQILLSVGLGKLPAEQIFNTFVDLPVTFTVDFRHFGHPFVYGVTWGVYPECDVIKCDIIQARADGWGCVHEWSHYYGEAGGTLVTLYKSLCHDAYV